MAAVKLRLNRRGNAHRPYYHIVAIPSRKKRNGEYCEDIGVYNPLGETMLKLDVEKARYWLGVGAMPSNVVKTLLKRAGVYNTAIPAA